MQKNLKLFFYSFLISYIVFLFIPSQSVDSDLTVLHNEFIKIADQSCPVKPPSKITIQFADIYKDGVVGECYIKLKGFHINIDKEYFYRSNLLSQKQLIFHELTHCYYGIDHVEDKKHYMYAYMNKMESEEILLNQVKTLLKERCVR